MDSRVSTFEANDSRTSALPVPKGQRGTQLIEPSLMKIRAARTVAGLRQAAQAAEMVQAGAGVFVEAIIASHSRTDSRHCTYYYDQFKRLT